ncbi:hypothetical protein [Rhizobium alvei]|uniref:Uncharacterized protein n=1 Tax=Rhizobium alvei TaxID=1132659 RepID=A0ABT8YHX6_9HYPH|nr:hypothetical protein [Rhizobium alvei]MDO6963275.1 hypothetical protein [Rhizobium alvei]
MSMALKLIAASTMMILPVFPASAGERHDKAETTEVFTFEHEVEFFHGEAVAVDAKTAPTKRTEAIGG